MQKELCLPKRETLILVPGYNVAMRAKFIDRWRPICAFSRDSIHSGLKRQS